MRARGLVIGNWKMNTLADAASALAQAIRVGLDPTVLARADVAIAPPYPFLTLVADRLKGSGVKLAAQELWPETQGAWTGAVNGAMLASVGCQYVLVGHSERRQHFGETDASTALRMKHAVDTGLTPVLCVGETETQRRAGSTLEVVQRQLRAGLSEVDTPWIIAYEPVWAIGTGQVAAPEDAQQVHQTIRAELHRRSAEHVPILYGGSVRPENAEAIFAEDDVDGALVGGASLEAETFLSIVNAAAAQSAVASPTSR